MFIDIAANLTDDMFQGVYHEKKRHESDLGDVIERARNAHCQQMIVLAGTLLDAYKCLDICNQFDESRQSLFTTVGFHPTRCLEAETLCGSGSSMEEATERLYTSFVDFIGKAGNDRVVAIGEFGLDYDRLHFCPREVQMRYFEIQLMVAKRFQLPLLLHLRNAFEDFVDLYVRHRSNQIPGVVHSFTGTVHEMKQLCDLGLYIGVNGCSLRDAYDVVKVIPEDRLLFETDAPYCDIKPTHPGFSLLNGLDLPRTVKPEKFTPNTLLKGRNEPCNIQQVAYAVAKLRQVDYLTLTETVRKNTIGLFSKLARR
jgi:TatD DNase family protein